MLNTMFLHIKPQPQSVSGKPIMKKNFGKVSIHMYEHACIYTPSRCVIPKEEQGEKRTHPGGRSKASSVIGYIKVIAPSNCKSDGPLASTTNTVVLEQLWCPVCLDVLCQPVKLPCIALVCTMCTMQLFIVFNYNDIKCPCCYLVTSITPSE